MAFPNVDWTAIKAAFNDAMNAWGQLGTFTLFDTQQSFTIRVARGIPGSAGANVPITAGMDQNEFTLVIMYDAWHASAGAGRSPQKGDQVVIGGVRLALQRRPELVSASTTPIAYKTRLRG